MKTKWVTAHVRLEEAEHAALKWEARQIEGVTLAVYLRQLIREAINARKANGNAARG